MNTGSRRFGIIIVVMVYFATGFKLVANPESATMIALGSPPANKPSSILAVMQQVANWQLAHPTIATNRPATGWVNAAGDAGMMALAGISGDVKYRDAMLSLGETNQWQLGPRKFHADDQCIGQAYAELYLLFREPEMIAPLRTRFNEILAIPPATTSLNFSQKGHGQELWSWADALFMAPPAWMRLYAVTGDEKYLNFAVTNWWRTTDYLYDTNEHLFYRDSTYFDKREANGKKIFWGRGNGWVMAGLVRVLQYLPMNHPGRSRFEQLFKDVAGKILTCQQPDGLWRASLLDPDSYPLKESSGSGFYTYALAWGVNQGLLDRATFEPAVQKAWTALVGCVDADGKLTNVQPIGADPKNFAADSTEPYGSGAFLLAGSEVYRTAVLDWKQPEKPAHGHPPANHLIVKVTNPAEFRRENETIELDTVSINGHTVGTSQIGMMAAFGQLVVMDGVSSRILESQFYFSPDAVRETNHKLLFQADLAPGESRTFYILDASALAAVPPPIVKTTARYVPERHGDFSWESDRIAHRLFGKALETWSEEPLTSSGVDVWIKRTRNLAANEMYRTGQNYDTNWVMQDDYKVGKTRGCGGVGIWDGLKLYVSKNWRNCKMITTGPIRSEFELTYDAWDAGNGRMVSETKRISIDAGSNMSCVESTFSSNDRSPLQIGIGVAERPGENIITEDEKVRPLEERSADRRWTIDNWQSSTDKGLVVQNQAAGWLAYWQPQDFNKGTTAVAIVLPKGSVQTFTNDNPNLPAGKFAAPTHTMTEGQPALRDLLAVTQAEVGKPLVYYLGAGWDLGGDFPNAKSWTDYVRRFAERRDQPLQVTVGK